MSFSFGTPKPATGFTLPTTSTPSTTTKSGAGDNKQTKPTTALVTSTGATGFSLGTTPKTTAPTLSFGSTSTTSAPSSTYNLTCRLFVASTSAATPLFGAGTSLAATSATSTTAASISGSLKLSTPSTASTTTPSLGLGGLSAATALPAATGSVITTTATGTTSGALTYAQLEDSINKWTIDLGEQGKFFINQTKQLNAWDHLLVSNSDKIVQLNDTIERIKQKQKQLDQELDFVVAQQNELDELSLLLEKQLADIPITDQNRFQTYQLSEIIDSQLKQMSEDLKEIVEHLNESNKEEDISDPMIQITRILNAHMNSLQWIDRNTAQISSHLEQVSQIHETYKKNHLNL